MTTSSEFGPVTPIRRPDWGNQKPTTGLDTATPMPKPQVPGPVKPPYPENPVPMPKPPIGGPVVPPKPPVVEPGTGPGTGKPPVTVPPGTQGQPPSTPGSLGLDFMRQVTPNEIVENRLNNLLSSDSRYIQSARQRGLDQANSRGMLNSSISAGNAERAAIDAALPIAQSDADVYRQANAGNFESLSQLRQMRTAAELDNWLGSETYNREFNGRLAMLPIQSAADMLVYMQQRAMEDPAVYSPEVLSGMSNFFNQNFGDIFSRYFNLGPGGG